jgi:hypothetical protein
MAGFQRNERRPQAFRFPSGELSREVALLNVYCGAVPGVGSGGVAGAVGGGVLSCAPVSLVGLHFSFSAFQVHSAFAVHSA